MLENNPTVREPGVSADEAEFRRRICRRCHGGGTVSHFESEKATTAIQISCPKCYGVGRVEG